MHKIFWNTEGFLYEIFRDWEPKSYKHKLLKSLYYLSFFDTRFFVENTELFPHENFWYCETKKYQQKIVKSPYCP